MRVILPFALLVALVACAEGSPSSEEKTPTPATQASLERVPVRVVRARDGSLSTTRTASATLTAATDSAVVAEASGRVVEVLRKAGDRVGRGDAVLRLDDAALRDSLEEARLAARNARVNLTSAQRQNPEDRAQAQQRLRSARTALDNALRIARANETLEPLGGVSGVELRASRAQAESAAAELEAAQAAVARLERAGTEGLKTLQLAVEQADARVRQLERDRAKAVVRAPFAGEIAEVAAQQGEFLSAGSRAFRLVDTSSLRVSFLAPAPDAALLTVGRGVRVTVGARVLEGRVARNAGVPGDDRLVRLQARFVGGQDLSGLRPGALASAQYRLTLAQGALVPSGALRLNADKRSVLVVRDGVAQEQSVTVLGESGGQVAVRGLEAGENVITPVPSSLSVGKPVQIVGAP
jgi:multidrug efflux pump subunit AcrA (membrane-fusion protein)